MSVSAAARVTGRAIRDQYRLGLALFVAAPVAVLLVMLPEFAQHVVEIRIGMFDSVADARALSDDPTRWAFGYAKLTGLTLAFLACTRAAWSRIDPGAGRWYDPRGIAWGRLAIGFVLFMGIGSVPELLGDTPDAALLLTAQILFSIVSVPFLLVALSGLFGDGEVPWRQLARHSVPAIALLLVLMLTGFGVMQVIHAVNHRLAIGSPAALVWLLMVWDTLVVGAIAALTGAAWAISYRQAAR